MKSHKKPVHAVGIREETNIPPGFREPSLGSSTWDEKIWRIVCNIDFVDLILGLYFFQDNDGGLIALLELCCSLRTLISVETL